ncbi:MAG: DUF4851 domain-containing protein [Desulfovibrio sp.]|jgi:hypothetical protein|nr:DUF4851 domain-containing protein [Desulfovibrio sp.]
MKTLSVFCLRILAVLAGAAVLFGCAAGQQRGMNGAVYVSTARPAISLGVTGLPLLTAGEGATTLLSASMPTGAPTRVWLAVYGEASAQSPMAIVAHAELHPGWYWDSSMRRPFSVNEGVEVLGGLELQACTYTVDSARDPFSSLIQGLEESPTRWIARGFAARTNFFVDKIILEYRERLPEDIASLTALPFGKGDFVKAFEQRARESFIVASAPSEILTLKRGYASSVRWRYMNEKFLGTASRYDIYSRD